MAKNNVPISLKPIDDIFGNPQETGEKVEIVKLNTLHYFNNHPFKVVEDEKLNEMAESIKANGVTTPIIARLRPEGGYEIVSGHRRHRACQIAGLEEIPCIVRELTDDQAIILMVDANLQRETILPSERAWAYRLKLDAMSRQGQRSDLTSRQVGEKFSVDEMAENVPDSARQIHRYIRLTYLIPPLLEYHDTNEQFSFNAAVSISYLNELEQQDVWDYMQENEVIPSVEQGKKLKYYSQTDGLTPESIAVILHDEKDFNRRVVINNSDLKKYFPEDFDSGQINAIIFELLEKWKDTQEQTQNDKPKPKRDDYER